MFLETADDRFQEERPNFGGLLYALPSMYIEETDIKRTISIKIPQPIVAKLLPIAIKFADCHLGVPQSRSFGKVLP